MEEMGSKFVEGAKAKGIDAKVAREVFELMAKFAEYGFIKAHATGTMFHIRLLILRLTILNI